MLDRFFSKVKSMSNGCDEWKGSLDTSGYGLFRVNGKLYKAHRYIFEFVRLKKIPKGKIIRHKCDNPKCVNVKHLELGTKKDNAQDREKRNRSNRRTRDNTHGMAKVSSIDIQNMVKRFEGGETKLSISKDFPISYPHTCKLINEVLNEGL